MELQLFDVVAEACRGLVPAELGEVHLRSHRYGVKAWFGPAEPSKEHYEAQVIGAKYVPEAKALALELGFHAEHPKVADNDAVIARVVARKKSWRRSLGDEVVVGPFLGREEVWRRVSETWADPDLSDPDLVLDIALRLVDYFNAIEPVRRG